MDLLAVQGTPRSLLQHHSSKALILWSSAFFMEASLVAQRLKDLPAMRETQVRSLDREDPGEGKAYALQYSSLENSIDCILHGVAKSWT